MSGTHGLSSQLDREIPNCSDSQRLGTGDGNRKKRRQLQRLRQAADAEEDELKRREAALALRRQRLLEATEGLQRQQQRVRSLSDVASARSDNAEHWELWQPNNLNSVGLLNAGRLEDTWRLLKVAPAVAKASPRRQRQRSRGHSPKQQQQRRVHSSAPTRVEAVSFAEKYRPKKMHKTRCCQGRGLLGNSTPVDSGNDWVGLRDWETQQTALARVAMETAVNSSAALIKPVTMETKVKPVQTKPLAVAADKRFRAKQVTFATENAEPENKTDFEPPVSMVIEYKPLSPSSQAEAQDADESAPVTVQPLSSVPAVSTVADEASADAPDEAPDDAARDLSSSIETAAAALAKLPTGSNSKPSPVYTTVPLSVAKAVAAFDPQPAEIGLVKQQPVGIATREAEPAAPPERRRSILRTPGRQQRKSVRFADSALVSTSHQPVGADARDGDDEADGDVEQWDAAPTSSPLIPPPPPPLQRPQSQQQRQSASQPSRSLLMRRRLLEANIPMLTEQRPAASAILLAERRRFLTVGRAASPSPPSSGPGEPQPAVRVVHHHFGHRPAGLRQQQQQQHFHSVSSHQQRRQATAAIARKLEDSTVAGSAGSIVFPGLSPSASPRSAQSLSLSHPSIRVLHQREPAAAVRVACF
uniref:MKLP1_Arf_bdg domain-containing protein n=1 Tax=Macrostomum lignano TaxID=282301 RepID=A0A1I8HLV7_9PLAT